MMNEAGIKHVCGFNDCYALNEDELEIRIHTNKSIVKVTLVSEDPYILGCSGNAPWDGKCTEMQMAFELKNEYIYSVILKPKYKRVQYYFEISDGSETKYVFEDGIYDKSIFSKPKVIKHFFKFGWMNDSDINAHPDWVEDTVWYQIFPERFCRVSRKHDPKLADWADDSKISREVLYGGNIAGVTSKLEYLKGLGVNGIYFNPIFSATQNHKYNINDYLNVDPAFGTNQEFAYLVEKAHSLGIKVMIDAVFNHSGRDFFAWQDVVKKGRKSRFWNWYYINSDDFAKKGNTRDGRYYTFAFVDEMPKLNTNNKEVMEYFLMVCKNWIKIWDIDGIRFDVGNEISHSFIKYLRRNLRYEKKDLFLLGEIWLDSSTYLLGDEYDSVMNYPFMQSVTNFFVDRELTAADFIFKMNYCYSMYQNQVNRVVFNLLDSHDVERILTRCGSYDAFVQQLAILLTMPGSPCIYYGTEAGIDGENDPYNRKCMPWDKIEKGECDDYMNLVKALIAIRLNHLDINRSQIKYEIEGDRAVSYVLDKAKIKVVFNAGNSSLTLNEKAHILFSHKYENSVINPGGVAVFSLE
ncbi:MAG: alpha amylase N-terminal ig-like domain-containing protein [Succinivibrio sp.]